MQEQMSALQKFVNTVIEFCVNYSFQVLGAIIVLIVGSIIANAAAKMLLGVFEKKKLDITLSKFLAGTAKVLILAFTIFDCTRKVRDYDCTFHRGVGCPGFRG